MDDGVRREVRPEREPLELAPYVAPPAAPATTLAPTAAAAAFAPPPRSPEAPGSPRRGRLGTPVATSLLLHFIAFVLLLVFWPGRRAHEETEPMFRVTLRWHDVGDDPESDGSGPRGPVPEKPSDGPPRGDTTVEPGFLEDPTFQQGSIGSGGGRAGSMFAGRVEDHDALVAAGGGDGRTEGAVRLALEWLARHQSSDGSWDAQRFTSRCQGLRCEGPGEERYEAATTALAILPFLGAGHTYRDGPWKDVVRRGLTALRDRQRADGSFDSGSKGGYGDALCLLALSEAYGLTAEPQLGDLVKRSVGYFAARRSENGGWRYRPGDGDSDSSVTAWVAMALAAARRAGIAVPEDTLAHCRSYFAARTDAEGSLGYASSGGGSRALLAAGWFVPILLADARDGPPRLVGADRLQSMPPRWPRDEADVGTVWGSADPLGWYYGALAAFQRGGDTWLTWNAKLRPLLLDHQERSGCAAGSWPAVGSMGRRAGRVAVTALCAMTLEVYYRYPRAASVR